MSNEIKNMGKGIALAEKHRDQKRIDTFLADIFRGKTSFEKIDWTEKSQEEVLERKEILEEVKRFLLEETDPNAMSQTMDVPLELFEKMAKIGLFALKVPKKFGGKGLSQTSFNKVIELITSHGGPLPIVVSADASIGAKFPVVNYGTDEQKAVFIPELIKWPSGFAFTEQEAGSDATRMKMAAVRVKDEKGSVVGYRLTGQKWYTTNAVYRTNIPLAKLLAVVGKIGDSLEEVKAISNDENREDCFGIFIVPTDSNGLEIGPRNKFMGMAGIYNANPRLNEVFVPAFNLIGGEGKGFRIAMNSLNTGRIAIASGCIAMAKQGLLMSIYWGNKRKQFSKSKGIGWFEQIGSGMLAPGAADIFAMIAMTKFAALSYDKGLDVRLEAAACKAFASERMWQIVDNMVQIFGGRGYETYESWSLRETALPVERLFRDARPNRIFEGATELQTQSGIRDGLDEIFQKGSALKKASLKERNLIYREFLGKYLASFIPQGFDDKGMPEELRVHFCYVEKNTRKLIAKILWLAKKYQEALIIKQLTTKRLFWIGVYLNAMAVTCDYASFLYKNGADARVINLADFFCRKTIREIEGHGLMDSLYNNDDRFARGIAECLLTGEYDFILKEGIIPVTDWVEKASI